MEDSKMNPSEFLDKVRAEANMYEPSEVYKALKKYGLMRVYPSQTRIVTVCLVLRKYVKHITIKMVSEVIKKGKQSCNPIMRGLGDKNVLHLEGYGGNYSELYYVIHPAFLEHIKPKREIE
jgi:hypothetical protein